MKFSILLRPIDQALIAAGFIEDETSEATLGFVYHNPRTLATCHVLTYSVEDMSRLVVGTLNIAASSHLNINLLAHRTSCAINKLYTSGISHLILDNPHPITIQELELHSSSLHNLELHKGESLQKLTLSHSNCFNTVIEFPKNRDISLFNANLDKVFLGQGVTRILNSHLWGLDTSNPLHLWARNIEWTRVNLQLVKDAPYDLLYHLPLHPTQGSTLDLNENRVDYALLFDQRGNRHLQLADWLGTLDEFAELIERDYTDWPLVDQSRIYSQVAITATRKRYRHLIKLLRHTPVDDI